MSNGKEGQSGQSRTFWVVEDYNSYVLFNLNSYQCLLIVCHVLDAVLGTLCLSSHSIFTTTI